MFNVTLFLLGFFCGGFFPSFNEGRGEVEFPEVNLQGQHEKGHPDAAQRHAFPQLEALFALADEFVEAWEVVEGAHEDGHQGQKHGPYEELGHRGAVGPTGRRVAEVDEQHAAQPNPFPLLSLQKIKYRRPRLFKYGAEFYVA